MRFRRNPSRTFSTDSTGPTAPGTVKPAGTASDSPSPGRWSEPTAAKLPPTHRTGSLSGLLPHFRCRKQYRKAPALLALPAAPGLLLGPATGPPFLNFRPRGSRSKTDFIGFAGRRARTGPPAGPRVCSPFLASPYSSVQGSKLFPAQCRPPGPGFAPHSPLALIPPSKGANFFMPGAGRRAQGLLPTPR